ncbi:MAG: fibronectin type III domain-containing protein [Candidatus Nanopelagicales bacterium]
MERRRRLLVVLIGAALGLTLLPVSAPSADASPSGSTHLVPYSSSTGGVTITCFDATGFSCTSGGYDGTSGQYGQYGWGTWQYWQWGSGGTQRHNCTTYASFKLMKNGYSYPGWTDNANGWDTQAWSHSTNVDQTPAVGAIGQWNGGSAGHVAYVEAVTASYVEFTSDNYGLGTNRFRVAYGSAYMPDNFIHFKDVNPVVEGAFVSNAGAVYRIAGGAPIYVSAWSVFGGGQPTTPLSDAEFNALRQYPVDGAWVVAVQTGAVYRIAGGAPLYVSSWAHLGIPAQPVTGIDQAAIDSAGAGGVWNHLRPEPSDMFLRGLPSQRIFRVVSGHPYYVSSWTPYGGTQPFLDVDDFAIDNCLHFNCNPFGYLDSATTAPGGIRITGWVMDPNATDSLTVHVYADGHYVQAFVANQDRPDVDAVFHRGNPKVGYYRVVPLTAGSHRVCVYGINVGAGNTNTELGCLVAAAGASPPSAPTNVHFSAGGGRVVVSWSAPTSDGGTPVLGYSVTSTPGGKACTTTGYTCTLSGLTGGAQYTVRVTARNAAGTSPTASVTVTVPGLAGPRATARPRLSKRPVGARSVSARVGTWSPTPTRYRYQWLVDGRAIPGATHRLLKVRRSWHGHRIAVRVWATAPGRGWGTAVSRARIAR